MDNLNYSKMNIYKQNYSAIVSRGLITPETTNRDFLCKLHEEVREVHNALYKLEHGQDNNLIEEITDCINVLNNWLIHAGYEIDIEMEKCLTKNLNRIEK